MAVITEINDAPNTTATPYVLAVGDTFAGEIGAIGDRDRVAIDLTAGQSVEITLIGVDLHDPVLRVFNADGGLRGSNDDDGTSLNSFLSFLPTVSGTFYIEAAAYGDTGIGSYEMTVTLGGLRLSGDDGDNLLTGSARNDTISGGRGDDTLLGLDGDDLLYGEDGNDSLSGGAGNDTLRGGGDAGNLLQGGEGDDLLIGGYGMDVLEGGIGDDVLIGGVDADVLDGGDGFDVVRYIRYFWNQGTRASLIAPETNTGAAVGDIYIDIEGLVGTGLGDVLIGDLGDNLLRGMDGNDRLFGLDGDDLLQGGYGDDRLFGGNGDDRLEGGDYNDILYGGNGNDTLFGGWGNDTLTGGAGADELRGGVGRDMADYLGANQGLVLSLADAALNAGAAAGDVLFSIELVRGTFLNDIINGNAFNNVLRGHNGDDVLRGGGGADRLFGGNGDDILFGGTGDDILQGGGGADSFIFATGGNTDTIADFTAGIDSLTLDEDLWGGGLSEQEVVDTFGRVVDGDFVLEFQTGDTVVLRGFDIVGGLAGDIDLI